MPSALESTCLGIFYFTMWLIAGSVVYEYVFTEGCAPSALLLVSRPEPALADCSLATERRAARQPRVGREATSLYSCVTIHSSVVLLLLAVVDYILNLKTMPFSI